MGEERGKARWYAVHVRSNQERTTERFLAGRRIERFLPTYRIRSRRTDRSVMLSRPLFTGYLFVRIDPGSAARVEVLRAPGAVGLVGFGTGPAPVSDETIASLKILVRHGEDQARPHPLVRAGGRVKVFDGPFCGAVGILHETDGKRPQLVVEIEFLGRAVAVPILPEQVHPLFD